MRVGVPRILFSFFPVCNLTSLASTGTQDTLRVHTGVRGGTRGDGKMVVRARTGDGTSWSYGSRTRLSVSESGVHPNLLRLSFLDEVFISAGRVSPRSGIFLGLETSAGLQSQVGVSSRTLGVRRLMRTLGPGLPSLPYLSESIESTLRSSSLYLGV